MSKETVKRYIISTLITFFAGVAMVVVPKLNDNLTIESLKDGTMVGILFAGVRLGVKMVLESFLFWYSSHVRRSDSDNNLLG